MKYDEAYQYGKKILEESLKTVSDDTALCGGSDAARDAKLLLEYVCHTTGADLYARPERPLSTQEETLYKEVIEKRSEHIPYAYITGETEFMGLPFQVNDDVLIPRQDTETLVEECMPHLHDGMTFMDLCTGSGCIALSLLRYSNYTTCVATDLSEAALHVAERNARQLLLSDRIRFVKTDLFPKREEIAQGGVDLIVSNPPYIKSDVIATLQEEVRDHEPVTALDGGADGMDFYRRIAERAPEYLCRGGILLVEIGYDQGESVPALFQHAGFKNVLMIRDLANNARVVSGVYF